MIIKPIAYTELEQFEDKIAGNVRVGGYKMDRLCPIETGTCYQISLNASEIDRVRLLREVTFTELTQHQNYYLSGLLPDKAIALPRVKYWFDRELNLSQSPEWSPVFVSPNLDAGLIVAIDGNHRLMAHYIRHQSVEGVPGYLFVHPNLQTWDFMPRS